MKKGQETSKQLSPSADEYEFDCGLETHAHSACAKGSFYKKHKGRRYCVLHYPSTDKREDFEIELKGKIESNDFNFEGVWFPPGSWFGGVEIAVPGNFRRAYFSDGAYFRKAVFKDDVTFEGGVFTGRAGFDETTFAKKVDFSSATFRENASFRNAVFKGLAKFWRCTFEGDAEFDYAEFLNVASFWPGIFKSRASFSNASFVRALFGGAEFGSEAVFSWCAFRQAEFFGAYFDGNVDFLSAKFDGLANFAGTRFSKATKFRFAEFGGEARFISAAFNGENDFGHAVFKESVGFSAEYGTGGFDEGASFDFRRARFDSPKRVSFHSVTLRPHWFVNVDAREFQFVDVRWFDNLNGKNISIELSKLRSREEREERESAKKRAERMVSAELYNDKFEIERLNREEAEESSGATGQPENKTRYYRLLSITCRQLAVNAEENHRYEEASKFRYWAMDTRRLERWKGLAFWRLGWWYWLASGYGERIMRAFIMLVAVWLVFAAMYTQISFARPPVSLAGEGMKEWERRSALEPDDPSQALTYSLRVMTLQKPEPVPETTEAQVLVTLETIFGPLQVALLALAIRRKFMR
jgi:uncharacterized protein YjbI with pentapeptide repeats